MLSGRRGQVVSFLLAVCLAGGSRMGAQPSTVHIKERMSAAQFERCGLHKLTPGELAVLEDWLAVQLGGGSRPGSPAGAQGVARNPSREDERTVEVVSFNTSTGKYHCRTCQWALRCTRNCIDLPRPEARRRGVPCKVCGGSCQ
jgi:hypothetical protein